MSDLDLDKWAGEASPEDVIRFKEAQKKDAEIRANGGYLNQPAMFAVSEEDLRLRNPSGAIKVESDELRAASRGRNDMSHRFGDGPGDMIHRWHTGSYTKEGKDFFRRRDQLQLDEMAIDNYKAIPKVTDEGERNELIEQNRRYEAYRQSRGEEPYSFARNKKQTEHVDEFDKGAGVKLLNMFTSGADHADKHMTEDQAVSWNTRYSYIDNPTEEKEKELVASVISNWWRIPMDKVERNFEYYSAQFTKKILKLQGSFDNKRVFSETKNWLQKRVDVAKNEDAVFRSINKLTMKSMLSGDTSQETIKNTSDELAKSFGENGIDRSMIAQTVQKARGKMMREYGGFFPLARRILETEKSRIDKNEENRRTDKDLQKEIQLAASMHPEDRKRLLYVLYKMAESEAGDYKGGFNQKVAESFVRGLDGYLSKTDDFIQSIDAQQLVGSSIDHRGREFDKNTANYRENVTEFRQDLFDVQEIVSKIDSDNVWIRGIYSSARSLPYSAAAFVPYVGVLMNTAVMATDADIEFRKRFNMPRSDRKIASLPAGVLDSLIERLSAKWITHHAGKLTKPLGQTVSRFGVTSIYGALDKAFKKVASKVGIRGVAGTLFSKEAGHLLTEYGEEGLQGVSKQTVMEVANSMSDDFPEYTKEEWHDAFSILNVADGEIIDMEVFAAILPTTLLFSGGAVAIDRMTARRARDLMSSVDIMWYNGLDRQTAKQVKNEKDVFKAQKIAKNKLASLTNEERQANRSEAIKDGAEERIKIELVKEHGTESEKAMLEEWETREGYRKKYEAVIEEKDDGKFALVYPEEFKKPTELFESEAEAATQMQAHEMDVSAKYDEELLLSKNQLEGSKELKKHLKENHEGSEIESNVELEQPIDFANRSKKNMAQMLERVEFELRKSGIDREATVDDIKKFRTVGQNILKQKARGYIQQLSKDANISTIVEEGAEGFIKDLTMRGDDSMLEKKWVKQQIIDYNFNAENKITKATTTEEMSDQEMIETFSDLAMGNFWNSRDHEQLPSGLRSVINALRRYFLEIMNIASDLKQMRADGMLDSEFETLLDQSIGINMDEQVARMKGEAQQEILNEAENIGNEEEAGTSFSISPAQDAEYMSAVESDDVETQQEMVDEAAKRAGYKLEGWHYTNADINDVLDKEKARTQSDIQAVYLMDRPDPYREYGDNEHHVFVKANSPANYDEAYDSFKGNTDEAGIKQREKLQEQGFDSVIIPAEESGMEYGEIIIFDSNQAKSADSITYDSKGKVIPLSQRFNEQDDRISFSIGEDTVKKFETLKPIVSEKPFTLPEGATLKNYLIDNFSGKIAHNDEVGDVEFRRGKFRKMLSSKPWPIKWQAIPHLPELIENAILLRDLQESKDKHRKIMVAKFSYEGKEYAARLVLEETKEGQWYYNHEMSDLAEAQKQKSPEEVKERGSNTAHRPLRDTRNLLEELLRVKKQDDRLSFSIARKGDPVAERIHALMRNDATRTEVYRSAVKRLDAVRARVFLSQMVSYGAPAHRDDIKEAMKGMDTRQNIAASIAQFQAIMSVLPVEVRGKVGGVKKFTEFKSIRGAENYLIDRIDMADKHLDLYLKKKNLLKIKKLVKAGMPKKGKNQKIAKGKITAHRTDELKLIQEVMNLTVQQVEDEITKNQAVLADSNSDEKAQMESAVDVIRLQTFGGLEKSSAATSHEAMTQIEKLVRDGKAAYAILLDEVKRRRGDQQSTMLDVISGGKGKASPDERDKAEDERKKETIKNILLEIKVKSNSFEHLIEHLSRLDDSESMQSALREWTERVHIATMGEDMAVASKQVEFETAVATAYGIDTKKALWNQKVVDVLAKLGKRRERSIKRSHRNKKQVVSVTYGHAHDLVNGLNETILINEGEVKVNKEDIAAIEEQIEKHPNAKIFKFTRTERTNIKDVYLSNDEIINLTMLYKQDDYTELMHDHGYTEEVMQALENELSESDKALRQFIATKYEQNYDYFNAVYSKVFGVNMRKTNNYSKGSFEHQGLTPIELKDAQGGQVMSVTPGSGMARIRHNAEPRSVGASVLYLQHVKETEHFVHWAELVGDMRATFLSKDVQDTITTYHGNEIRQMINNSIQEFTEGGVRLDPRTTNKYIDKLRKDFTVMSLSYKWAIMVKQFTSLPAYASHIPFLDYMKYQMEFFTDPAHMKKMWDLPYTQHRLKAGYDRDVMLALNQHMKTSKLERVADWGMKLTSFGDIVPVIMGGYAAYRYGYEQAKKAKPNEGKKYWEAKGVLSYEMNTANAQQSGYTKDQSAFAKGGSLARVLTMYTTSPLQYTNNTTSAILDVASKRKHSKKKLAKMLFINHVVLPSLFYWVSHFTANLFKPDEDKEEIEDALSGWYASMALGGFSGLFIFGKAMSSAISGFAYKLPVFSGIDSTGKAGRKAKKLIEEDEDDHITTDDVIDVLDLAADAISYTRGKGLGKAYEISKNVAKSLGFTKDDMKYISLPEKDRLHYDIKKTFNKIQKDYPLPNKKETSKRDYKLAQRERWELMSKELLKIKEAYPHLWEQIEKELKEKKKIPSHVQELIRRGN